MKPSIPISFLSISLLLLSTFLPIGLRAQIRPVIQRDGEVKIEFGDEVRQNHILNLTHLSRLKKKQTNPWPEGTVEVFLPDGSSKTKPNTGPIFRTLEMASTSLVPFPWTENWQLKSREKRQVVVSDYYWCGSLSEEKQYEYEMYCRYQSSGRLRTMETKYPETQSEACTRENLRYNYKYGRGGRLEKVLQGGRIVFQNYFDLRGRRKTTVKISPDTPPYEDLELIFDRIVFALWEQESDTDIRPYLQQLENRGLRGCVLYHYVGDKLIGTAGFEFPEGTIDLKTLSYDEQNRLKTIETFNMPTGFQHTISFAYQGDSEKLKRKQERLSGPETYNSTHLSETFQYDQNSNIKAITSKYWPTNPAMHGTLLPPSLHQIIRFD